AGGEGGAVGCGAGVKTLCTAAGRTATTCFGAITAVPAASAPADTPNKLANNAFFCMLDRMTDPSLSGDECLPPAIMSRPALYVKERNDVSRVFTGSGDPLSRRSVG